MKKNAEEKIPPLSSLSFLTTATVFMLTLLVMMIGGYFIATRIYDVSFENLQREAGSAAKFAAKTLARPLWDVNEQGVRENLESMTQNDVFCGARVIDADGKLFFESHFPLNPTSAQTIISEPVMFLDPTENTNKIIGTLEVCATMMPLKLQVAAILNRLIISFGFIAIGILIAMHFSLQILMKPLRRFQRAIMVFQKTMNPITDPELTKKNEVGYLVKSFNTMAISLSETYRALKGAKEDAEEAFRVKTDFFANMSHELRTPLNSVIGMTQLLETRPMDEEQREMFDSMHRSAESLLKIVNDILDVSKIEAKQIQLEYLPFDAYSEIRHTVQSLQPQAAQKGLGLSCKTQGDALRVFGDPSRFNRIMLNLVGNAVNYTEKGSVQVRAEVVYPRPNRAELFVSVIDTGIGIPFDKLGRIFDKFTQADTSTTRKYGGTGLGLTITRELIELMGGTISVESDVGKGSTFSFKIPFEVAKPSDMAETKHDVFTDERPRPMPGIAAENARILLAEDHPSNQLFMRKLFQNLGVNHFMIAENGREALRELDLNSYDLVLMDCHMPEMNGYDTTIAIRNMDDPVRRNLPIVAMTANAMPEDEQRCLNVGMNGYISKPVDIQNFKRILSPWITFPVDAGRPLQYDTQSLPVNLDNLRANAAGDKAFEAEMIALFVTQAAKQINELTILCSEGENEAWVETAHALKGTAGSVGAEKMRLECARAQVMKVATDADRRVVLKTIKEEYWKALDYLASEGLYNASTTGL